MSAATLTAKGQIVIPAEIRKRHGLTPGTQLEFTDEGGVIRLIVRRRVAATDPAAGYGMLRVAPVPPGAPARRLADFDAASLLAREPVIADDVSGLPSSASAPATVPATARRRKAAP